MNRLESALSTTADDLNRYGSRWALVGGFAVSARSTPRFTRDVDVAVMVADDDRAEALVRSFMGNGYTFFASVEHDNGRLATVRFRRHVDGVDVLIDVLFASSGLATARQAVELITDRGFNRNRDLAAALAEMTAARGSA